MPFMHAPMVFMIVNKNPKKEQLGYKTKIAKPVVKWINEEFSVWDMETYKNNRLTSDYVEESELRGKAETVRVMTRRTLGGLSL